MNRTIEFTAGARTSATAEEFAAFVDTRFTALRQFGYLLTGDWQLAERLAHAVLAKVWFRRATLDLEAVENYTLAAMVTAGTRWWRRAPKTPQPALLQALATLPRRTRAIVVLRYLEDLPDAEIAQIMRCSVNTVQAHLTRGVVVLESS